MAEALIDNDVLYKTAMYGLLPLLMQAKPFGADQYSILGAAKYMITKRLAKRPPARGADVAVAEFLAEIAKISALEPSVEEVRLAAELEYAARKLNLELDSGESILCAVLLIRKSDYIFTGDKRAIIALSSLILANIGVGLAEKVVCLEQLFMFLIHLENANDTRTAVCSEAVVDKTLSNCFSCLSITSQSDSWREGLSSYIEHLKRLAPNVLARTD